MSVARVGGHEDADRAATRLVRLRRIGLALFVVSFVLPGFDATFNVAGWGVQWFVMTPVFVAWLISEGDVASITAVLLFVSWLSNFIVFVPAFRSSRALASTAIALPWLALIGLLLMVDDHRRIGVVEFVSAMLPFFAWAFGLGLIHLANALETPRRRTMPWRSAEPRVRSPSATSSRRTSSA